jgi:sulfate permease
MGKFQETGMWVASTGQIGNVDIMFIVITCTIAIFFAINIGASGAAASMGIAYGSGAIPIRKIALIVCGIGILLGAVIGGGEVVNTIGSGIVPEKMITIQLALIILGSASITLFFANFGGIPLSTSEVTVGAVIGVGVAFQALFVKNIAIIVLIWFLIPFIAFSLAFLLNPLIKKVNKRVALYVNKRWKRLLVCLVIFTGFLEAFSAGMNNVANSVGPIVASGIISVNKGTLFGGIFVALGAFFFGGRVIETNGKRITQLDLLQGGTISGIGATLVIIASLFGIPVPQAQITTSSILGIGVSNGGKDVWKKTIIVKLIKTWLLSPFISMVISYYLVEVFIFHHFPIPVTFFILLLAVPFAYFKINNTELRPSILIKVSFSNVLVLPAFLKRRKMPTSEYKENP